VTAGTGTDPVALLVDPDAVSELVGERVVAVRLRHKPGMSTVAALSTPAGRPWGWVQLTTPQARDKARNAQRRARDRNRPVHLQALPGGGVAAHGPVVTDPRLHRALDQLPCDLLAALGHDDPTRHAPEVSSWGDASLHPVRVLRHNPLRRLVLRRGDTVLRLTQEQRRDVGRAARVLLRHGVPVSQPLPLTDDIRRGGRVSRWAWVSGADLHVTPDVTTAQAAGAALAAWHGTAAGHRVVLTPIDPTTAGQAVVEGLRPVSEELADRVQSVLQGLVPALTRPQRTVWAHGDFSADQVIGRPGGGAEILDLDRLTLAPPAYDLGSFAAVELLRSQEEVPAADLLPALLEGYAQGVPDGGELTAWTAYALLLRAGEPLRRARPAWRSEVSARLDLAEEVLHGALSRA
jgi:aminoglycoside phosphotransferase (APT) family kinase protein